MQALSAQMLLPEGTIVDGATFIPVEVNNRFIQRVQPISLVELGKNLLRAAREGNTDQVRELMGKGAPFTTDWLGTSPLHFAALNNHLETCEVLLRAGISRDSRTKVDRTPLHMAAYEGHISIVEVLLSNGADVDARDMLKMTPLHWAVQNGHADVVTLLLRHGANPDLVNKFEKSPTDIAVETNRLDLLQLLQVITRDVIDTTETLSVELGVRDNDVAESTDEEISKQTDYLMEDNTEDCESHLPESLDAHLQTHQENGNIDLSDSMQMLKDHGISFLPVDNSSVVASAMENGHSIVLTEVGKQVLNSTKPLIRSPISTKNVMRSPIQKSQVTKIKGRQVITVTPEQLLAMANSSQTQQQTQRVPIIFNGVEKPMKRIVMNKNKIIFSGTPNPLAKKAKIVDSRTSDLELMSRQLAEARREAEEYKQMLRRKEAEAERYKRQLQSITQTK